MKNKIICGDALTELKEHRIRKLVNAQAEDEGLWFIPQYASEAYLQAALRKLHAVIEEE